MGLLKDDELTLRTRQKKDMNIDAIREKIASDCYAEFGRKYLLFPKPVFLNKISSMI